MDFSEFQNWAFLGLLSSAVIILGWMGQLMMSMNIKLAVILEKISYHETRISKLEQKGDRYGKTKVSRNS